MQWVIMFLLPLLLVTTTHLAMGQLICPKGTYMASNYTCIPQQPTNQTSQLAAGIINLQTSFTQLFAKSMGVKYNPVNHKVCLIYGGGMFNYILAHRPNNMTIPQMISVVEHVKDVMCPKSGVK